MWCFFSLEECNVRSPCCPELGISLRPVTGSVASLFCSLLNWRLSQQLYSQIGLRIIKPDGLFFTLELAFTFNLGHLFNKSCFWIMSENGDIFPMISVRKNASKYVTLIVNQSHRLWISGAEEYYVLIIVSLLFSAFSLDTFFSVAGSDLFP